MRQALVLLALLLALQARPSAGEEIAGWHLSGSNRTNYAVSLDRIAPYAGTASAVLSSTADSPNGFGALVQEMGVETVKGYRVRITAFIRSEGVKDWAGLWMRVDGTGDAPLAIDNMHDRPIKGDTAWAPYSIVLDIPADATALAYGILLSGQGRVSLDDLTMDVIEKLEPTAASSPTTRSAPFNVGFED